MEIPILFLEDYASSQTVCILKWGYSVAQSFSEETNWYKGTITFANHRSSIHGLFFVINGVGVFANSHNNSGIAINNGDHVVSIVNSPTEGFSEYTDRNHGSPSAVYIRSSITSNDIVIYNVIGRTNGHSNKLVSVNVFRTDCVGESTCIEGIVCRLYSNNNVNSGFLVGVDGDFAIFTCFYVLGCINFNVSVCIALACNIDVGILCIYSFYNIAIGINNRYANLVGSFCFTRFTTECKAFNNAFIYNSYFSGLNVGIHFTNNGQSDVVTNIFFFFVRGNTWFKDYFIASNLSIQQINCIDADAVISGIGDVFFNTIFVNSLYGIGETIATLVISDGIDGRNNLDAFNIVFIKFTNSEGSIYIFTSFFQSHTYGVFTSYERSSTSVLQGINIRSYVSTYCQFKICCFTLELIRCSETYIVFIRCCSWFSQNNSLICSISGQFNAIVIGDNETNSVGQIAVLLQFIFVENACIKISQSDVCCIVVNICTCYIEGYFVAIFRSEIDFVRTSFCNLVGNLELTVAISGSSARFKSSIVHILCSNSNVAAGSRNFEGFVLSCKTINSSSYSVGSSCSVVWLDIFFCSIYLCIRRIYCCIINANAINIASFSSIYNNNLLAFDGAEESLGSFFNISSFRYTCIKGIFTCTGEFYFYILTIFYILIC